MVKKAVPGGLLVAVGAVLVASLLYAPPDAGQGGPAVAWAVSVVVLLGGGGLLAVAIGLFSVAGERVRLPTVVLAAYGAVGLVYLTIRLMLFPGLPVIHFTILAVVFVILVTFAVFELTDPELQAAVREGWGPY